AAGMDDLWLALESIERRDGNPALIKHLLAVSFLHGDPALGNWFWYSKHGEITELIDKIGVKQFSQDEFMQQTGKHGGWNRLWQPRTLRWAHGQALRLVADFGSHAAQIPVMASTVPAFNGAAVRKENLDFILINMPLIVGLVGANMVLFDLNEFTAEGGI